MDVERAACGAPPDDIMCPLQRSGESLVACLPHVGRSVGDDSVLGFESKNDVNRFLRDLKVRFAQLGLTLNEDRTRVLQYGRFAAQTRARQGLSKPPTFDFLGFTHIYGKSRSNVPGVAACPETARAARTDAPGLGSGA